MVIPGEGTAGAVKVPSNTLVFRAHGMQVAVLGNDGVVHLKSVDIGRDYGNTVELVNGVTPDDQIVLNPPDSLADGQKAQIAPQPKGGATETQGGEGPDKTKADEKTGNSSKETNQTNSESSSSSPGQAPEKQSTAPGKSGGQTSGGGQPDTGMTPPGSDGTSQK
jgi:hypothetical protein